MDTTEGESGETEGVASMYIYTTLCKRDSQWEAAG